MTASRCVRAHLVSSGRHQPPAAFVHVRQNRHRLPVALAQPQQVLCRAPVAGPAACSRRRTQVSSACTTAL